MTTALANSASPSPATTETEHEVIKVGRFTITGKDIGGMECQFDRISISSQKEILCLSIIAEPVKIKAIRSILAGGSRVQIQGNGVHVKKPGDRHHTESLSYLSIKEGGYNTWTSRLPYGLAHALFMSRAAGFMTLVNPETLWQELNEPRFTTPVLREWMPYIEKRLRESEKLELCLSHRCACGILSATTSDLDAIVEDGLQSRTITVPNPNVIDVPYSVL